MDTRSPGQPLGIGIARGTYAVLAGTRWPDGRCERPWRVRNPTPIPALVALRQALAQSRPWPVALEPAGTYGDARRQARSDARRGGQRVRPKAAHASAASVDGVPSPHDGKAAAVVAALAALGQAAAWPDRPPGVWEQALAYGVDWLAAHRRLRVRGLGRIAARLARHWPEAPPVLELSAATWLRVLARYGGPVDRAAAPKAVAPLPPWGGAGAPARRPHRWSPPRRHPAASARARWRRPTAGLARRQPGGSALRSPAAGPGCAAAPRAPRSWRRRAASSGSRRPACWGSAAGPRGTTPAGARSGRPWD